MRKSVFVLAVIGAACSSVAFAGEVKQTKTGTTMSDAQMDRVTAGDGFGLLTANGTFGNGNGNPQGHPGLNGNSPRMPGLGNCTAGHFSC